MATLHHSPEKYSFAKSNDKSNNFLSNKPITFYLYYKKCVASEQTFLYTLCISKMASKNTLKKFWLIVRKHVHLQPILRKSIKIAVMQRQKFNIIGGLNIQSTWCLECDSYMHTSSIAAPRYSDRKTLNNLLTLAKAQTSLFWSRLFATFHIARGGSGLLLT